MSRDGLVVDEGAIRALQIFEHAVGAFTIDAGVTARHRGIVDDDVVVGRPADRNREGADGVFRDRSIVELQDQLGIRSPALEVFSPDELARQGRT